MALDSRANFQFTFSLRYRKSTYRGSSLCVYLVRRVYLSLVEPSVPNSDLLTLRIRNHVCQFNIKVAIIFSTGSHSHSSSLNFCPLKGTGREREKGIKGKCRDIGNGNMIKRLKSENRITERWSARSEDCNRGEKNNVTLCAVFFVEKGRCQIVLCRLTATGWSGRGSSDDWIDSEKDGSMSEARAKPRHATGSAPSEMPSLQ